MDQPVLIQWANLENFRNVKNCEFAVCSATDATKTAREPLSVPVEENTWRLERWIPGQFPVDRLTALGDGTFLCAILSDGQRISNVSRVRIDRAGEPPLKPGFRITPVILSGEAIRYLAIRVIPAPGQHIHIFDLYYPFLWINGSWSHSSLVEFSGQNIELKPGSVNGMVTGFEEFEPKINPFAEAKVRAKFTEDALKTIGQSFINSADPSDETARMKSYAERSPGYLSDEFTLTFSRVDTRTFDAAFALK